jgi:hypothetical protein
MASLDRGDFALCYESINNGRKHCEEKSDSAEYLMEIEQRCKEEERLYKLCPKEHPTHDQARRYWFWAR